MLNTGTISLFESVSLLSPNHTHLPLTGPLFTFTSKNAFLFSSSQQFQQTHLCLRRRDNGIMSSSSLSSLCAHALNKKGRKGGTPVLEVDGSDFDDYGDDDKVEEEGEDLEDEDDVGEYLPLEEMKRWLENKPRGFGENKVYDTSIEEKLLQEIEKSREAQIANVNKLKNDPLKTNPHKEKQKIKEPDVIPSGIRVRLVNLPKKKNIHRDLKSAFEDVRGIINISPAVSGNKKTKDPICKGFAFVDFKSEEDATRFMQVFSTQSISFGKIQKQIKCEMMNSTSSKFVDEHSTEDNAYKNVEVTASGLEEEPDVDSNVDYDTSDSWVKAASDGSNPDGELDSAKMEDIRENLEIVNVSELNGRDSKKPDKKSARDSSSSNQQKKIQVIEKKQTAKGKVKKVPKLSVPGSAKRLNVKEKAVLTDVFSKYAVKAALTSRAES
ncbi:hypothetical protein Ddye_031187 [Dipteronia dyeriana]|uniref:RRM domain-containing protein n=1 Tax=Dipteronia dyeriana TaxID=168575 RepID=A0AAD9THU5_9ROSI|nr:hypothetical protein Ddye_031187 [Dipteronia dyeriana]